MVSKYQDDCEQAKLYFYNMLNPDTMDEVPKEMFLHVANCLACIKKLARLHKILSKPLEQEESSGIKLVPAQLVRHFDLLKVEVDCKSVKEFLPLLVNPEYEITIPTPVTVHIDQCSQCIQDLEALRSLNLNSKQLATLAEFFSKSSFRKSDQCSKVSNFFGAIGKMDFAHFNSDVLKHICLCKECRNLLSFSRLAMANEISEYEKPTDFPCEQVKAAEIFTYCLPYGLDPDHDEYIKFRESLTGHLRKCPTCLEKMRQLTNTLHTIADRDESGVATCYEFKPATKKPEFSDVGVLYADWPIRVQVCGKTTDEVETVASSTVIKKISSHINIRTFKIPAAAAVILIAIGLFFFNTTSVTAIDLSQLFQAILKVENVHTKTFITSETIPSQEIWLSRNLNVKLFRDKAKWVLWDAKGKSIKTKGLNNGEIVIEKIPEIELKKVLKSIEDPVGLVPFDNISEVPKGAKWEQVEDEMADHENLDVVVYDLEWSEISLLDQKIFKKWRGYLDTEMLLPVRVEMWQRKSEEEKYKLINFMQITYLSNVEVQTAISNAVFDKL
jgi:hypothetical protein